MRRQELERRLRGLGWRLLRHGGRHDVWTNLQGTASECVPRHREINEILAGRILKNAKEKS